MQVPRPHGRTPVVSNPPPPSFDFSESHAARALSMTSVSVRLLVLWTLFVVLGTLAPFDFRAIPLLHRSSFGLFRYGSYERDPVHFALNLVLFVPLGALLHHEARRRQLSTRSILLITGAIGLLFSLTVEYLQGYL